MKQHGANANTRRASARGARRSPAHRSGAGTRTGGSTRTGRQARPKKKVPATTGTPRPRSRKRVGTRDAVRIPRVARSVRESAPPTTARSRAAPTRVLPGRLLHKGGLPRGVLVPVVAAGVLAFSIWSFYPVAKVQYREEREKARLEAEHAALAERNARLAKQVARLRTPEGVEDAARDDLGYVKQGEHAVVVVDPAAESTVGAVPAIDSEPVVSAPRGPWTATLDAFFGYHE